MPTEAINDQVDQMRVYENEGSTQVGFAKMQFGIEREDLPIQAIPETSNFSPEQ